ncbi:glycoside hydrolase family 1 protein [Spiroplasma taiwanense]|uniref:6-phospho-beta-glucosidase n=1 Tax=Spiroplasma taiwanense CT-1 TaxID=1276220 RepID=S5MBY1_9MOLU|nr:glycoside hydrolase family 1 protein [Spiroplasma taiwanense]AGR41243.1 6-phospho-beta-glucosidase [Spiroplasma taiwanense CT-1]
MSNKFPKNFLWGASTSAYQFEGGWDSDGKGPLIQDVRKNIPNGTTDFKVDSDHYNNWKEDIALMAEMGFKSYRFSISWTRILPKGFGKINKDGINFYNNIINELLKYNIIPIVTMYHFDLPNELEKNGGWLNRETIDHFANYAKILFENFGDRVKYWLTINEQNVMIIFGEIVGVKFGEGKERLKNTYQVNHHMMLAQAKAMDICHQTVKNGKIGSAPNIAAIYPNTNKPEDQIAALNMKIFRNWFYLDCYIFGIYNKFVLNYLEKHNSMFEIYKEDLEILKKSKPDFIAFNYYASGTAEMSYENDNFKTLTDQQKVRSIKGVYRQVYNPNLQKTQFGWEIDPIGLKTTLREIYDRYRLPLIITENGIGGYDELIDDKVNDDYRIDYYQKHIEQLKLAINDGVELIGYNPWSAIYLVSTHEGIKKRYGFVFVNRTDDDLKDLKRYRKKSFYWYQKVIENNGL